MKALKLIFILMQLSEMHGEGRVNLQLNPSWEFAFLTKLVLF